MVGLFPRMLHAFDLQPLREIQGLKAYEQGDYLRAKELLSSSYRRGLAAYKAGEFASSRNAFLAAIGEADAPAASSWHNLGNSYFQLGQYQQAIEAYQQALALQPDMRDTAYNKKLAELMLQQPSSASNRSPQSPPPSSNPKPNPQDDASRPQQSPQQAPSSREGNPQQPQAGQGADTPSGSGEAEPPLNPQGANAPNTPPSGHEQQGQQGGNGQADETPPQGEDATAGKAQQPQGKPQPASPQPADRMLEELRDEPGQLIRNQMRQEELRQSRQRRADSVQHSRPW